MESFSWRHKTFSPLALSVGVHLYLGSGLHLANWGLNDSHNYTIFSHISLYRKLIKDSTKPNHFKSDIVPQSIPYLKRLQLALSANYQIVNCSKSQGMLS